MKQATTRVESFKDGLSKTSKRPWISAEAACRRVRQARNVTLDAVSAWRQKHHRKTHWKVTLCLPIAFYNERALMVLPSYREALAIKYRFEAVAALWYMGFSVQEVQYHVTASRKRRVLEIVREVVKLVSQEKGK